MAKREAAVAGMVAWVDLQTPDLDKARGFYGELLGWTFVGGDAPDYGFYTTAHSGGRKVAGMAKLGPRSPFPPMWSVYFGTDSADATAAKVQEAGGEIVAPPTDVMEEGRMAYFKDPTGVWFGAWQPRRHQGAELVEEPGAMTWHEAYTRDVTRAVRFYAEVFGLEQKRMDAPGMEYWTLHQGPTTVCGVMQMNEKFAADAAARWNTYFAVADVDASAMRVASLGGKVEAPPFDSPYGRLTMVADPFGARFCLVQLPQ